MMMIKWTLITMDIELSKWRMRTRKVAKWTVASLKISPMMKVSMMRNKILKNKLKFDWVRNI
jgi:beta-lactamase class D